ncbi:hypothetical protein AJ80_04944 [Polytolypa hystricis UAMH7299]|uniref:Secreted protein n=1 Tax=Polytolypa hystricis (strain UAMH7299) TaxID=1447883 RepID=A0A2B7Y7N9_POLH7|nr:hypothetical protein AJ80_04944 [Polytolypa hystricis UAMH7299]
MSLIILAIAVALLTILVSTRAAPVASVSASGIPDEVCGSSASDCAPEYFSYRKAAANARLFQASTTIRRDIRESRQLVPNPVPFWPINGDDDMTDDETDNDYSSSDDDDDDDDGEDHEYSIY